jgi:hypothetical protein
LTEASLLSGTPRKDRASDAKGGLLAEMGDFGILLIKDFSGMLSLNKESRSSILSALREIYDGSWTRYVGMEGGRKLEWRGKCGLIGAATPSIDSHYAVMSILGERFCYYRIPDNSDENDRALKALKFAGQEKPIREKLIKTVTEFFYNLVISNDLPELTEPERDKMIALSIFTTRCRSAVEREGFQSHEIQLIPGVESPTRLVKVYALLFRGLLNIGISRERAWELIERVSADSMPALRHNVLLKMLGSTTVDWTVTGLSNELGYPTVTTRRSLEDMACYHIIDRESQGKGKEDLWRLNQWTIETYSKAFVNLTGNLIRNSGSIYITNIQPIKTLQNSQDSISDKVSKLGTEQSQIDDTLPDCHNCGQNDWKYDAEGRLVCQCGYTEVSQ